MTKKNTGTRETQYIILKQRLVMLILISGPPLPHPLAYGSVVQGEGNFAILGGFKTNMQTDEVLMFNGETFELMPAKMDEQRYLACGVKLD